MKRQIILKTLRDVGLHYFKVLDQNGLKAWIKKEFKCSPYLAKTCAEILIKEIPYNEDSKKSAKISASPTRPATERSSIR